MKPRQFVVLVAVVLATGACTGTGNTVKPPPAASLSGTQSASGVSFPIDASDPPADAAPAHAGHPAGAREDAAEDAGEDAEAVHTAQIDDPWESYNRAMYKFNTKADKYVFRPIGVAYDTVVPDVVQLRIASFFANLKEPWTMVNQVLQGRPAGAAETLGRFVVNTTAGVGGIFDPATQWGLERANEDLGQTLAVWGWKESTFFIAPLQGPKTVRDFIGGFGEKPLNPTGYIEDEGLHMAVRLIRVGSMRSAAFPLDELRAGALDEYAFVRDAWIQRRKRQIDER